jgi:adenylyltransferase/sulfurtransferase
MNDDDLLRYSRQIMLPQIDINGQERLLAAAGVGRLVIADPDTVELSNLQRQLLHRDRDIGREKADSARDTLLDINPHIQVTAINAALQGEQLDEAVRDADVVLDCSDNFDTRFAVNASCVQQKTPLVSGAAVRFAGQLAVFDAGDNTSPCYSCLYKSGEETDQTCSENGVLAPVVGIIGAMQALEAIKTVLRLGENLTGRLVLFDGLTHEWRSLKLPRDPECPVCGTRP